MLYTVAASFREEKKAFLCRRVVESPPKWRPAYTCSTVFLCTPPVSLTYLSLLFQRGGERRPLWRPAFSVLSLHRSNCLFVSTCLSNLPVSLLVEEEKNIHLCGGLPTLV
jgi:hypothetical protein